MDSTVSPRLVTSVLALLFCLVASFRAADVKPVRMVTEVVAISMVNPRVASPTLGGDAGVMHLAASGAEGNAIIELAPIQPSPASDLAKVAPVPAAGRAAPARPRPEAKPSTQVARAMAPRPRVRTKARSKPAQRPPVMAQAEAASPQVPALLVPLRRLGLSIRARLPGQPVGIAPAAKPGDPCGPMAV